MHTHEKGYALKMLFCDLFDNKKAQLPFNDKNQLRLKTKLIYFRENELSYISSKLYSYLSNKLEYILLRLCVLRKGCRRS